MNRVLVTFLASGSLLLNAAAAPADAQAPQVHRDVVYATVDGRALALDIHMPVGVTNPPLLVWVHGGMWRVGNKGQVPPVFAQNGFAVASLDFRQSTDARFPAMVHDIKGAIRFLRAHQRDYGYRADRIAIGGTSSGGHLAALVGVTNGSHELEGTVGGNAGQSSDVQAIVSYYGASNLQTILAQSTPFGLGVREPALRDLLGGLPDAAPALAALGSPVVHTGTGDPPLLLLHGDQDPQMPINQAHELEGAYEAHGLDVTFDVVHGGVHGGEPFYAPEHLDRTLAFLRRTIGR